MIVVCASESPRSAIISTRSRKLSFYRRYQRTQSTMISRSKWRPLKRSSTFNMLGQVHRGLICRRICATPTLRTRTLQTPDGDFGDGVLLVLSMDQLGRFTDAVRIGTVAESLATHDPIAIAGRRAVRLG
jgi:hypothetical protein